MGIQDRDYMRERRNNDESPVVIHKRWWLFMGIVLAISLVLTIIGQQISKRTPTVNVNSASLVELDALPRISETIAQAIIDGRPYSSADDLIRVYGIGPKTLEMIRPYVRVSDEKLKEN